MFPLKIVDEGINLVVQSCLTMLMLLTFEPLILKIAFEIDEYNVDKYDCQPKL